MFLPTATSRTDMVVVSSQWRSHTVRQATAIVAKLVLAHYNSKIPIVLTPDASTYYIGSVTSHRLEDGFERFVAFASCTLSDSEMNYHIKI